MIYVNYHYVVSCKKLRYVVSRYAIKLLQNLSFHGTIFILISVLPYFKKEYLKGRVKVK